jgi:COP9 signalosome complex subunit 2
VEVESSTDLDRVNAVREWSDAIGSLWGTVVNEGDFRSEETSVSLGPGYGTTFVSPTSFTKSTSGVGRAKAGGKGKGPAGKKP